MVQILPLHKYEGIFRNVSVLISLFSAANVYGMTSTLAASLTGFLQIPWKCSAQWTQIHTAAAQSSNVSYGIMGLQPLSTPTERLTIVGH